MRELNLHDVYRAWDVLDAAGYDEAKVESLLQIAAEGKFNPELVGIKTIAKVLRAFMGEKKAESAMYTFLAGPFEKTPEEMQQIPLRELAGGIVWIIKDGGLVDFFSLFRETDTN